MPRVALLTNFIPPYRVSLYRALRDRVGELRIFVSTAMERNRAWHTEWGDLDVVQQRSITLHRTWRTERFAYPMELHIPYDTIVRLREWRPDVILTGEMGARTIQAIAYAKGARKRVVLWATLADHLEDSRGRARKVFRRRLLRHVDHVIVNGVSGARYMQRMGVDDARVSRAPYTTDLAPFAGLPLERTPELARRLIYVGMVTQLKGIRELLAAVRLVAEREPGRTIDLTIVGDGDERAELQAIPQPANVHVHWSGAVAYSELPDYYREAGIFVFPTLADEWGVVVNEAMAAGVPVIGSRYSGAVIEMVLDGVTGWRFEPTDIPATAEAIERALSTPADELQAMRAAARALSLSMNPNAVADTIAAALLEMKDQ